MQDAWRAYLELALGLTEASKKRAQAAARKLVGSSGATAAQLQTMAEELVSTGMANREALIRIIRVEIDRTLAALGLATADEVTTLTDRISRLERELAAARAGTSGGTASAATALRPAAGDAPTGTTAPVRKAVVKKAVAKSTVGKKAVAKKAVAKKAVAKKAVAKKTVAKQAAAPEAVTSQPVDTQVVAKKTVAKKAVAKKNAASKAVVSKKSTPGKAVAKRSPAPGGDAA
ncbi:hypothetical protein C6361_36045 [Plantactinospora sp. BC1]|uniref:phasin family protein n=1 Tax=Plantactinospora sp. BC1 TaxID=2108470 RepID=UPI000D1602D6|nr:histone H1-like repetitive region-containing protein [Plantactinospora sp. BC1]AVT33953.1 hypothetical protein C6361_36045 [Plantactinospora sp. BC1]